MTYRKLKDGSYAAGFIFDRRFIPCTSAFDAREAKALVKAVNAVLELFHATSGAWVTLQPDGNEIRRGASRKVEARAKRRQTLDD
jgi:hypothetical protein